ncbi:Uncharacterised protein [Zhongshania aliphaticivorans]|uniref:TonB-dependent receptor n=1 Tax=Zhongshania aliphaticivorans TaxID=1470434 RepID=A0A5S9P4Y4_9GAMM|nr:TonB-dependent receptor [Zhongshania aliphaticivorans]CAA0090898.1 Uncharacterised protein [Zhongshania aliphaticivorans]CAA0098390.1 Uncharacterised protein [Zhongshania aliphaticivorans]
MITRSIDQTSSSAVNQQTFFKPRPLAFWVKTILYAGVSSSLMSGVTLAQESSSAQAIEEVVVLGTRKIIQDQIGIKRDATSIVEGLSASEIGALPALSIGEALESITGAASHRENGGATEISIRGLGPFLSATTFNGRGATNGSGDRSVNFSQFPSELMSKIAIHKTQDASIIEGGVAGVIALETLRPLNASDRAFQIDAKMNYNPDEANVDNSLQDDFGFRGTASYVDQFEFSNGSAFGVSLGVQSSSMSQSEAEYRSSSPSGSSLWACLNDPSNTNEGFYRESAGDCEDQVAGSSNQGYNTEIDPNTGEAYSSGTPYAWTGSSRGFRQNETSDERDSYFAAFQFQPNDDWDINLDMQFSERVQAEERHDLIFEQKRVTPGVTGSTLVTTESGVIKHWEGTVRPDIQGESYSREEDYKGGGLNISHRVTDRLRVDFDASYSKTNRIEEQISVRSQGSRVPVTWTMGSEIPTFTVQDFDVTDPNNFMDGYRARVDRENVAENIITAFRLDLDYDLQNEFIPTIRGGIRSSKMTYLRLGGNQGNGSRTEYGGSVTGDTLVDGESIIDACAISFPESDFLSSVSDGNLITNVDANGDTISQGTGSSYAAFDNKCIANALASLEGEAFAYPDVIEQSAGTIDVTEETLAAYIMADYEASFLGRPIHGNFGIRIVQTDVTSVGYRVAYEVVSADPNTNGLLLQEIDGDVERISSGGSYTKYLPSVNFVWEYDETVIMRGGLFRGMSRADPVNLGYSRSFDSDETGTATSVSDLVQGANGSGNPDTQPLMSWNADFSLEWYPNDDTILSAGIYYKKFVGGYEQQTVIENFVVGGETVALPITNTVTTEDTSDIYGLELTGSYRWNTGIGVKAGYNYSDSNFKFEDSLYGDTYTTDENGVKTQLTEGIIAPANIPGFSKHVFSGQVYYQIGEFDVAAIYKYRSQYFQPYTSNGTRIRYVDDAGVWEARASYNVSENVKIKIEAINLFSEPKTQYFFTEDNLGEVNDYGPRLFAGVTVKF